MTEFREVLQDVSCELEKAEYYASEARKHKGQYPELATIYAKVAAAHRDSADMLMRQAEFMKNKAEHEKQVDAISMVAVYEYACERAETDMETVDRILMHYRNE